MRKSERGRPANLMKPASILLGLPLVATILISLIQATRHLSWDWPVHAHHHLLAHITTAVGLSVVSLLILAGPLQRRERWAWWALLVSGMAIYGGFWLGNATVGLGEPGTLPNTSQAAQTLLYSVGLFLGWRELQASEPNDIAEAAGGEPFYRRSWFKRTMLVAAVAGMLVLLGLLFSPRYWRF